MGLLLQYLGHILQYVSRVISRKGCLSVVALIILCVPVSAVVLVPLTYQLLELLQRGFLVLLLLRTPALHTVYNKLLPLNK